MVKTQTNERGLIPTIVQITEVRENSYALEAWTEGDNFFTYESEMYRRKL
jgi:hypothetical protein